MNVPYRQDPVDALLHEARLDPAEATALADLLHAAAPGAERLPAGTPGEYAALAAFRNAHRETATHPLGAFAMYRNRTRAALLTAKTAAAALVLVSAGGVAVAATTGTIPTPLTGSSHPAPSVTPKATDDANESDGTDENGTDDNGTDPTTQDDNGDNGALRGTCTAFSAGAFGDPTAAATNTAFRQLVIAAGGQDKVAAFCAALPAANNDGQGANHGNSANAPGHDPNGPGNSENAPGHDPNGPGNSENAPGHNKVAQTHGNSANAPGHNKGGNAGHGNSANAPGHNKGGNGNGNGSADQNNG
jgi:hypothetical protein